MPDRRFKPKKKPSRAKNHALLLVLLAVLLIGSVVQFVLPDAKLNTGLDKINQGLDIQGGLSIVLEARRLDGSTPSLDEMSSARQIVERRVNLLGASEARVQVQGTNQLLVEIPGLVDQTQAIATIGQIGILEFVNVADLEDQSAIQMLDSGYSLSDQQINEMLAFKEITTAQLLNVKPSEITGRVPQGVYVALNLGDQYTDYICYQLLTLEPGSYTPIFTGKDITNVTVGFRDGVGPDYSVNLSLNTEATRAFADVTTKLYPTRGKIAIVLDGAIQSAPAVQNAITTGSVSITGGYTLTEANSLKTVLQSGSLPVSLAVINTTVVGPTLGQEALFAGIIVAFIGLGLVALYLLIFYRGIGLLTAAAIFVFAVLYVSVLVLLSTTLPNWFNISPLFTLSLPGIAGIVLSIGVAADSSILILERFKEEIRMGRSVRASS
ncbi:MAG: protein translocase subunit SecD, partial [Coriobacteriia bacterium]|nr:protein translocase subunit SecD [Coriobacteriia bacterium]